MGMLQQTGEIHKGDLLNRWFRNRFDHNKNVLIAITGSTGCQLKGSKVLMANGEWKNIEDIKKGNLILSPQKDGRYKYGKIIKTFKWKSKENYDVFQLNKQKEKLYSCSYNHFIPVWHNFVKRKGTKWELKDISARELSKQNKHAKGHQDIAFSCPPIPRFQGRKNCEIEPYTLGVFLGDGMFRDTIKNNRKKKDINITTMDFEIISEISKYYPVMSIFLLKNTPAKSYYFSINSNLSQLLSTYKLNGKKSGDKFIPEQALLSDLEYRKKLLAGLIDTDGYLSKSVSYSITTKSKQLAKDILFLIYSLGGRGRINKIKKGIKKLNFIGEYYRISFFLHNIKIPIKVKRKIKEDKSCYIDSNRIAINVIPSKKEDYVYGFTVDTPSHYYITDNFMVTKNSGKSWVSHAILDKWYQQKFNKEFPVQTNTCFSVNEVMTALSEGNLRKGEFLIIEEAGANLNALDFRDNISKLFTFILQSFRSMNIGIIFNLPVLTFLNKSARTLIHAHFITSGIDFERNLTYIKPLFHQLNQEMGKSYWKYMRALINGEITIIERMVYEKPSGNILKEYEKKKFKFVSELTKSFSAELEHKYREERYKYVRKELSPKAKAIYKLRCKGLNFREVAEIISKEFARTTQNGCWRIEQTYLKYGYDPKSVEKVEKSQEK